MRYAKKKDSNHNSVASALQLAGWNFMDTHDLGRGFPDGIATSPCKPLPLSVMVEIKSPGGKLSPAEERFHGSYGGIIIIADSGTCALAQLSEIRSIYLGAKNAD